MDVQGQEDSGRNLRRTAETIRNILEEAARVCRALSSERESASREDGTLAVLKHSEERIAT